MSVARSADARDRGRLKFAELRPELWDDLVDLFGLDRGASGGCWCMWWRLSSSEYEALERSERRAALKAIVDKGPPPGLLAYRDDQAMDGVLSGRAKPCLSSLVHALAGRSVTPPACGSSIAFMCDPDFVLVA